jgi:outer membrane protein assembly factor BamD (BamD/ComL family)
MIRRTVAAAVTIGAMFLVYPGFTYAQVASSKSVADVKQSDKTLFDHATKAMQQSQYGAARALLETLINRHPDSDLVRRAKLSIANGWYQEGSFKQAELEYRDLITFFPSRPEVAEAQLKIEAIHKRTGI